MTDAFEATGDFSPAEIISNDLMRPRLWRRLLAPRLKPNAPNGFIALGLAPELMPPVPTWATPSPPSSAQKTIPLAMGHSAAKEARFIDLMVSSQTGSGKTAAFLLPVLHTLLTQQAKPKPTNAPSSSVPWPRPPPGEPAPSAPSAKTPPTRATSSRHARRAGAVPHA
jgi:hypothetical protein